MRPISRRMFLATSGVALLSACGGSGGSKSIAGTQVLGRWNNTVLVPGPVRLPVSFGKDQQIRKDGPATITGRILDLDGKVVVDQLQGVKHNTGIPNAYWLFEAELTKPDFYRLVVDGAGEEGVALQINDPSLVVIPKVGEQLPPFDTPTLDDARGLNPICTAEKICPFHQVTLTEALAAGKPVAYLIGTPAYCQTGFCGPILDLLGNVAKKYQDQATFVHAEVYTDSTLSATAPAVLAYQLDFEPVLFITDASGKLVHRLDAAFDESEMADAVASVI